MMRRMMLAAVGVAAMYGGSVEAGHGHHYHGPRFGLFIAPPVIPPPVVVAPPPVVVAPPPMYPAYAYPVYAPPVYDPAGFGVQTRNFSLFLGR
jgi:hypothetical protein